MMACCLEPQLGTEDSGRLSELKGTLLGIVDGIKVGVALETNDGSLLGTDDSAGLGELEGRLLGTSDCMELSLTNGTHDGSLLGIEDGTT